MKYLFLSQDGILDRNLIEWQLKRGKSINIAKFPFIGDIYVNLSDDEISNCMRNNENFLLIINKYYNEKFKCNFDTKYSALYLFLWIENQDIKKIILSFGTSSHK